MNNRRSQRRPFFSGGMIAAFAVEDGAANYLFDVVLTIQGTSGGDNGQTTGRTLSGSALTFLCDSFRWTVARTLEDQSAGQAAVPLMRTKKIPQSASIETKLENIAANVLAKLLGSTGVVVKIVGTCVGGNIDISYGIIENINVEYGAPSTLKFDVQSYGQLWAITTGP